MSVIFDEPTLGRIERAQEGGKVTFVRSADLDELWAAATRVVTINSASAIGALDRALQQLKRNNYDPEVWDG